jgi:hypothetical protein
MDIAVPFDDEARQRLQRAVQGDRDFDALASIIARAGAREALDQATGRAAPTNIGDQRSYRIYCLMREGLPLSEAYALVAGIFQVNEVTAKRYVDTALARFRVELDQAVNESLQAVFADDAAGTEWVDATWWVAVPDALIGNVRQIVHDAGQPEIASARKGTVWKFPDESYQAVRLAVGLSQRALPRGKR